MRSASPAAAARAARSFRKGPCRSTAVAEQLIGAAAAADDLDEAGGEREGPPVEGPHEHPQGTAGAPGHGARPAGETRQGQGLRSRPATDIEYPGRARQIPRQGKRAGRGGVIPGTFARQVTVHLEEELADGGHESARLAAVEDTSDDHRFTANPKEDHVTVAAELDWQHSMLR